MFVVGSSGAGDDGRLYRKVAIITKAEPITKNLQTPATHTQKDKEEEREEEREEE